MKRRNGFTHANYPVRIIVGAITTLIDIRIGHFSKESIAGLLICTEIGANSGRDLHFALTHHFRESLFYNQILTAVLVVHFSMQMVGQFWMQINKSVVLFDS